MPRLSVLMPVRDGAQYLRRAVKSTLFALPRDAELVVLDDGSVDGTGRILREFDDSRLRLLPKSEGIGVARGLNRLLEATDSQFVARMDADDVCLSWRFEHELRAMRASDFVFTRAVYVNDAGIPVKLELPGHIGPRAIPLHLLLGNILVHSTMCADRLAIERLGGYRFSWSEDYDLWLRACAQGLRIARLSFPCLLYRVHAGQLSSSTQWQETAIDSELLSSYASLLSARLGIKAEFSVEAAHRRGGVCSMLDLSVQRSLEKALVSEGRSLSWKEECGLAFRRSRQLRPVR